MTFAEYLTKILSTISLTIALSSSIFASTPKQIYSSIVFTESQAYLKAKVSNPKSRLAIQEGQKQGDYIEVSIVENHKTHVATLARLRVYSTGKILRKVEDEDREEVWLSSLSSENFMITNNQPMKSKMRRP